VPHSPSCVVLSSRNFLTPTNSTQQSWLAHKISLRTNSQFSLRHLSRMICPARLSVVRLVSVLQKISPFSYHRLGQQCRSGRVQGHCSIHLQRKCLATHSARNSQSKVCQNMTADNATVQVTITSTPSPGRSALGTQTGHSRCSQQHASKDLITIGVLLSCDSSRVAHHRGACHRKPLETESWGRTASWASWRRRFSFSRSCRIYKHWRRDLRHMTWA
jgi:hypothetical protein